MPASRLHLVRHGEVFNPQGVLYERIEGFELSDLGHEMAEAAAKELFGQGRNIKGLIVSPLIRAQQSAAPIAKQFGLKPDLDERVIEPWNKFKGIKLERAAFLKRPSLILNLTNPSFQVGVSPITRWQLAWKPLPWRHGTRLMVETL